ncbi:bucky ball-like isoform X2 [Brienomyrus brachyistius]|uniref:bucky ball-like isoform X2 n=1 Tax=Brienomyrus brachyistius TaxID=42636 RepID=UPI0020B426F3|nr:bucky ball-like isoform X2 [Brienomyrus brachyistius]
MEENAAHSMGNGQSHASNHSRPFFYVQPPSHPYYMCQWPMNSPFGPHALPGSGMPFGRPYWALYPCMQYPGYVMPHAPMQPADCRRMFSPPFPPTHDVRFRHQHHHQSRVRRETACSEVQTDPSDLVNELIESFSKFRSFSVASETRKELDSGVVSPGAGLCVHPGCVDNGEGLTMALEPLSQRQRPTRSVSPISATLVETISTTSGIKLRQSSHEDHIESDGWPLVSDVPPLDSSSVHEETAEDDDDELEQDYVPEKLHLADALGPKAQSSGVTRARPNCQPSDMGPPDTASAQGCDPAQVGSPPAMSPVSRESIEKGSQKMRIPQVEGKDFCEKPTPDFEDLPCRILRLPCDKSAAAGMFHKGSPFWCMDPTLMTPSSYLSSFGNALYCSYYPQTAQERQSVLSPSLDELSSRDELFSTDLEDLDLVSSQGYTSSGRLSKDVQETLLHATDSDVPDHSFQEHCPVCPKRTCSACGMRLSKEAQRKSAVGPGSCGNLERGRSDEEIEEEDVSKSAAGQWKAPVAKQHVKRRPRMPVCQPSKQKYKQGYCEHEEQSNLEHQDQACLREPECCDEHKALAKAERSRDQDPKCVQSHLCPGKETHLPRLHSALSPDRRRREDASALLDQEHSGLKQRPKFAKLCSRGQERPARRRVPFKTEHQRAKRDDYDDPDDENPPHQKGQGSTKRRGTRC